MGVRWDLHHPEASMRKLGLCRGWTTFLPPSFLLPSLFGNPLGVSCCPPPLVGLSRLAQALADYSLRW